MAAEIITPTDTVTGLPHPILIYECPDEDFWDFHHHNFPRRSPELIPQINTDPNCQPEEYCLEDIASIATRVCRGQLLPRVIHERTHQRLLGPVLPGGVQEKFEHVTKACSGVVSRWAIDVRRPDDQLLVYMDDETFQRVASTKILCHERFYYDRPSDYRRRIVGSFLLKYALEQDLSHVSAQVVDEFLSTADTLRRIELGNLLLKEALEVSLAPVIPRHQELNRYGMVQPGKRDLRQSVRKFIHPERLPAYHSSLRQKLVAAA